MASDSENSGECPEWDAHQWAMFTRETLINELEMEKEILEAQVKKLKEAERILLDERDELVIEVQGTREYIANARADRKMAIWLAISWVFFASVLILIVSILLGR